MSTFSPRRPLGRTGFTATAIGSGDLADRSIPLHVCVATLRRSLEAGINVIDTAPGYESGFSEEIVGHAVRGWPEPLFVIDKIDELDREVEPQVAQSLERLDLPSVAAFVFHAVPSPAVLGALLARGGGFDQLGEQIERGRVRHAGLSSHNPDVLREAILSDRCDLIMFPIGPFVDDRYVNEILPLARSRGVGTVCFKTFGAGKLLGDTLGYNQPLAPRPRGKVSSGGEDVADAELPRLTVDECLHYTLTLDPDVALLGLSYPNEQDAAFAAARRFLPLSDARLAEIRARAVAARAGKGDCWWNPDPSM